MVNGIVTLIQKMEFEVFSANVSDWYFAPLLISGLYGKPT
jgi:hypothetical protein